MCRDALRHLGPQPWKPEKVSSVCEKYVPMLAPISRSKGRLLDDASEKLASGGNCSTVDPTTGLKLLTANPWKPPLPGANPFTSPVYVLSSVTGAAPYEAPTPAKYQPAVAIPTIGTPPGGNMVSGVIEAYMANGQNFIIVSNVRKSFQAVISQAAQVIGNKIAVDNVTSSRSFVNASFTVQCPSELTAGTTAHNLVSAPKDAYTALLRSQVDDNLKYIQVLLKAPYDGIQLTPTDKAVNAPSSMVSEAGAYTAAASMFAKDHMPPLPNSVPPTTVLGTVKLRLANIASITSDPVFQQAIVAEIASAGAVSVSEVVVSSIQVFPEGTTSEGTMPELAPVGGVIEVYFSIDTPSGQAASATAQRLANCNVGAFDFNLWRQMAEHGSNRHTMNVRSVEAHLASELASHPASAEAARLPSWQLSSPAAAPRKEPPQRGFGFVSNGYASVLSDELSAAGRRSLEDGEQAVAVEKRGDVRRGVVSRVEVPEGRVLANVRALAATWALGTTVGGVLCAGVALVLAKLWRRRRMRGYESLLQKVQLEGDDRGSARGVEALTLADQALE